METADGIVGPAFMRETSRFPWHILEREERPQSIIAELEHGEDNVRMGNLVNYSQASIG
jgi:hypothetical protein